MGLLDQFTNMSPEQTQGLLAAAAQMLQQSGPSRTPVGFGQVIGGGLSAYQGATAETQRRKQQEEEQAQMRQMRDLQMQNMRGDIANQDMTRAQAQKNMEREQRIRAQLAQAPQGAGMPAAAQAMGSMLPGGPGSPKTGGPDWMQAYQAQQPQGAAPTPQAAPPGLRQQVIDRLMREAQVRQQEGDIDGANKLMGEVMKLMPEFSQTPQKGKGADNKPYNYVLDKDGNERRLAAAPLPDIRIRDDGSSQTSYDADTLQPGLVFQKQQTPDSRAADRRATLDRGAKAATDPSQIESIAQMIASGRMAPMGAMAMRSPSGVAIMARVNEINPEYRAQNFATGSKAEKDFATGKQGNSVRSFNVSLSHLDTLDTLADALHNKDTPALNRAGNFYAQQTGNPAPTNFDAAKKVVADEVVKAIVGSGGGVHDREEAARVIAAANSPAQLKGVISTYKELMRGQLHGLKQQYEVSTGRNDFDKYLSPAAKGAPAAPSVPTAGKVIDGYRFKGGDPSKQSNWEKM